MKTNALFKLLTTLLLVLALSGGVLFAGRVKAQEKEPKGGDDAQAVAVSTAFTYQGRLTDTSGNPIAGPCDFKFTLHDSASGGSTLGIQTKPNLLLNNGYFYVELDFSATAFKGEARWMEISVACPTGSVYELLTGRVALTAAPYALSLRPAARVEGSDPEYMLFIDNSSTGDGLRVFSSATQFNYAAIYGFNDSTGSAVYGTNNGGGYGVYGKVDAGGSGVYGKATTGGYGVYSSGNAHVEGNLTWKSKTSYIAVSAAAFRPQADGYDFTNLGCYVTNMDSASDIYEAPVQLPHGATVTGMTFYWLDGSALEDGHCYLKRNDLAGGNVTMALANTSGSSGTADSSQAPSISYATIDNSQYAYYLTWDLPDLQVTGYGVVIEYTITKPY